MKKENVDLFRSDRPENWKNVKYGCTAVSSRNLKSAKSMEKLF